MKKPTKQPTTALQLSTQTLRRLTDDQLSKVAGGTVGNTSKVRWHEDY